MEPWTGEPCFLNQNSYKLRNPGMEPWTGGVPLICKSELLRTLKFEDRTAEMEPWTDGAPLIYESELIQTSNSEDEAFDSWGAPDF